MIFWIIGIAGLGLLVASLPLDDFIASFDFGPEWLSGSAIGAFLAAFGLLGGLTLGATVDILSALKGGDSLWLRRVVTRRLRGWFLLHRGLLVQARD